MKTTIISSFFWFGLQGGLAEVWGSVNAMQLLSYVVYMSLMVPANAQVFLEFLIELSEFEFFDLSDVRKALFGWLYSLDQRMKFGEKDTPEGAERKLEGDSLSNDAGVTDEGQLESEDFNEKIAPLLQNLAFVLALVCFMLILKATSRCSRKVRIFWFGFYNTIFWNMPIRVFIEGYLPTAHQFITEMHDGHEWDSTLKVAFSLSSLVQIFLLFVAPLVLYRFFRWKAYQFKNQGFRKQFGDSTEILSHRNKSASVFFLTFCYKRLCVAWLIVYAAQGYQQVMGTILAVQFSVII